MGRGTIERRFNGGGNPSTTRLLRAVPLPSLRLGRNLNSRELVGRPDEPVEHARLVEQVTAVGKEVQLDLRPRLLQFPRGDRRRAGVVPPLDDDAWNALQLRGVAKQLTFFEPAGVGIDIVGLIKTLSWTP